MTNIPILFEYRPGDDIAFQGGTFLRGSPGNNVQTKRNGKDIELIAPNVLRDRHYVNGVRTTLMERGRTNFAWPSEDFTDARWQKTTVTITGNQITAPDGNSTADSFSKDIAASSAYLRYDTDQPVSGKTFTFSIWARYWKGLSANRNIRLHIRNSTETVLWSQDFTTNDTWQRFSTSFTFAGGTAGNCRVYIEVTDITTLGGYYLWGAQIEQNENGAYATSYIPATTGNTAADHDRLTIPFLYQPQAMWVYAKWIEGYSKYLSDNFYWNIGGGGVPQLNLISQSGNYNARCFDAGGTSVAQQIAQANPGDTVESLVILDATGHIKLVICVNGGAENATGFSGGLPGLGIPGGWLNRIISLNNNDAGTSFPGSTLFQCVRVGSGNAVTTIAQARIPATFIEFTDTIGFARLSNESPYPADRFTGWTPMSSPQGSAAQRLSDQQTFMFRTSDSLGVSFSLDKIPSRSYSRNSDGYTPTELADRLIYHLINGGRCLVRTGDPNGSYSPCAIYPGSKPTLQLSNKQLLEYTLNLQLLNVATVPQPFARTL